ncbi:MAG: Flp pilus assembly protein CpaB [Acetobacteraceae bacterium]|nr:Flp pilus assembly protein CpaB [Acetobacteraceae bacterium]
MRDTKHLVVAVVAALVTAALVYFYLAAADARAEVLIARQDIPARVRLQPGMFLRVSYPAAAVHPDALTLEREVVGKYLVTPVLRGEQVLRRKLAGGPADLSLAASLGPGERAVLVPVTPETGLGGVVLPGDRVDLVFVADERRFGASAARVLMRSLAVLDVRDEGGRAASGDGRGSLPMGLVVKVTPGQAERLAFALEHGRLYVALAGLEDDGWATSGVTPQNLFSPEEAGTSGAGG